MRMLRGLRGSATLGICIVVVLLRGAGVAQAQGIPSPTLIQPDVRLQELPSTETPEAQPPIEIPDVPPTSVPSGAETVRFVLDEVRIDGATVYPPEYFKTYYQDLIGTEVTLNQLYQVRADIERAYRKDGYFLTRVIVPKQTIRDGVFRLQVIEGYVDGLEFEGDIGPAQDLVENYLQNVVDRRPLDLKTLERYLLLANDIPGVNVQGVLHPSPINIGAARLVAKLGRKPFDALLLYDNYGNEFTGIWEAAATVSANSFTSQGEQISVTGLVTDPVNGFDGNDNEWVTQFQTSWRIGDEGVFTRIFVSYGKSRPGFVVQPLNFESETLLVSVNAGYPVIRSRDFSLTGLVGFDFLNSDTDIQGNQKFIRDRLRILHATGQVEYRDALRGINQLSASLRQGLNSFGATPKGETQKSRADASGFATVVNGAASRYQPLISDLSVVNRPAVIGLFGSVAAQYAFDDLLSDELFDVGGSTLYGRGYDRGELSGDHGAAFTGELQFTHRIAHEYFENYQLYGFYDYGRVWNRSGSDDDLSSAGGGIRTSLLKFLSLEFQVAKPLTRDSERSSFGRDTQFLFRTVARF